MRRPLASISPPSSRLVSRSAAVARGSLRRALADVDVGEGQENAGGHAQQAHVLWAAPHHAPKGWEHDPPKGRMIVAIVGGDAAGDVGLLVQPLQQALVVEVVGLD